jgi:hypothetical protein
LSKLKSVVDTISRTILYDVLPMISDAVYTLLARIFSPIPERRPSLAAIREVLGMDTFFLSDAGEKRWRWREHVEEVAE